MTTSIIRNSALAISLNAILFAGMFAATAAPPDLSKLPPASDRKDVTFQKDIQPLLKASCVQCHSGDHPKAGLKLDTLEHVLKGSKDGKVVTPGDSEKSQLVIAVAQLDPHTAMPPKPRHPSAHPGQGAPTANGTNQPVTMASTNGPAGGPPKSAMPQAKPLTPVQVGLVRAWIDQGAK